jgi:1-acyl-sn-glycerol-3-phosphate acyltransferase
MRIKVSGQEHIPAGAALFAGNHISYMDIAVLHSLVPASFVAKAEVGRMPVFGAMTWVNGTILVDRGAKNPREILRQIGLMGERLARGHPVILFAEGTSTDDGSKVQPFKGVLFKGLRPATPIVPFTLALQGQNRDIYTWYGDDVLGDLMRLFGYKKVEIHVVFHPAMYRKEDGEPVAKRVEEVVRHSHNALTYGADKGERGAL